MEISGLIFKQSKVKANSANTSILNSKNIYFSLQPRSFRIPCGAIETLTVAVHCNTSLNTKLKCNFIISLERTRKTRITDLKPESLVRSRKQCWVAHRFRKLPTPSPHSPSKIKSSARHRFGPCVSVAITVRCNMAAGIRQLQRPLQSCMSLEVITLAAPLLTLLCVVKDAHQ
jgi:hypothetical protein